MLKDVYEDHHIQKQQFVGTSGAQWSFVPNTPTVGGSSSFNDSGKADFGFIDMMVEVEKYRNEVLHPITPDLIGSAQKQQFVGTSGAQWSFVPNTPTVGCTSRFNDSGKANFGFVDLMDEAEKYRNEVLYPITPDLIGRALKPGVPKSERRKLQIANSLKAFQELLPNPEVGSQAHILDDVIDYVQYLQNQIKELGGSKLQTDSNAIPLVFHEGFGHYIKREMLSEPLEELMGKLLEEDPAAAKQLLENKGLYLLPIALADDLNQAS